MLTSWIPASKNFFYQTGFLFLWLANLIEFSLGVIMMWSVQIELKCNYFSKWTSLRVNNWSINHALRFYIKISYSDLSKLIYIQLTHRDKHFERKAQISFAASKWYCWRNKKSINLSETLVNGTLLVKTIKNFRLLKDPPPTKNKDPSLSGNGCER